MLKKKVFTFKDLKVVIHEPWLYVCQALCCLIPLQLRGNGNQRLVLSFSIFYTFVEGFKALHSVSYLLILQDIESRDATCLFIFSTLETFHDNLNLPFS